MISPELLALLEAVLKAIAFIVLYFIIGFGPGFVIGLLLANYVAGRNFPLRMDLHKENIEKAAAHNKQWHPDDPKWKT